ncbi:MAG: tetratricopeptide repeat protein [Ignavibacteria bacterium]|nr:tetratricopeptide repeat protein [Ignavibacteria bacterium]
MNKEECIEILKNAELENKKGNYEVGAKYCNDVLAILSVDDELRATALRMLAESLWRRGLAQGALPVAEEALAIAIHSKNIEEEAKIWNIIGNVYHNISDYPRALDCLKKALSIFEEFGSKEGIASNYGNIGIVYKNMADFPNALECFKKSMAMFESLGSKVGIATSLGNIGNIYQNLLDYTNALECYQKALSINVELGSNDGIARNYGNIGNVYQSLKDYTRALDYNQKALLINEEIGRKDGIAVNLGNIGLVYESLLDYSRALEYLEKSMVLYEQLGRKEGIARNLGNIGLIYSVKKFEGYDITKAEEYLLKAIVIGEEIGSKQNLYEIHKTLAGLYEQENDIASELKHFKKYHNLREEVLSEDAKKQVDKFVHERQTAEQEKNLAVERARSQATTAVLHKVLPQSIASRLIAGEEEIADYFPAVSILFADIAGFTPISAEMPAYIVVRFLNFVFREFDRIIKKHGCEKIKTIGDGYMAVAGAPIECIDHAERITAAAIEIQERIVLPEEIGEYIPDGMKFGVRVGLHVGSVVGGVIGDERFVYDIYSDAVNTAARMESHGEPDRIHVTTDFVKHLQNRFAMTKNTNHGINFIKRGEIEIKGKGIMRTYFLERA